MRTSRLAPFVAVFTASLLLGGSARAQIAVTGDVRPADDPRTPSVFGGLGQEGLPVDGNLPDFFGSDADGDLTDASGRQGQPNYERNRNVVIGAQTFGRVDITAGAALRYGHLVLGGEADVDPAVVNDLINNDPDTADVEVISRGFGVLRVTGFGSVYNNHPNIVPTVFQDDADPFSTFFTIPTEWDFGDLNFDGDFNDTGESFAAGTIQRLADTNFDAYIGLTGQGLLEITNGGRAEIQDAVIVGFGTQASGEVVVSGVGSVLTNYGGLNPDLTLAGTGSPNEMGASQMVIGAYGTGVLRIEDGGVVQALRGASVGTVDFDGINLERGGRGTVTVDGVGSQWEIVAGEDTANTDAVNGLRLGDFTLFEDTTTLEPVYEAEAGQGSLTVSNGGRVRVLDVEANDDDGDLQIGRFGDLNLANGFVEVQNEVYSDGVIAGDGEILAGRFVNRSLGEVRVRAGESLLIRTDTLDALPGNTDPPGMPPAGSLIPTVLGSTGGAITNYFGINLGSIQVIGDEANGVAVFTYERADDLVGPPAIPATTELRFWNSTRTNGGGVVEAGEIIVNNGHLHFRAGPNLDGVADGLLNDGIVAFVGGENMVTGTIENSATGEIIIDGPATFDGETFVTFADAVANAGALTVTNGRAVFLPGSTAYSGTGVLSLIGNSGVNVAGDFQLGDLTTGAAGALEFTSTITGVPQLVVNGDFTLETGSTITIDGVLAATAGDTVNVITVLGDINELETELAALTLTALPTFADPDLAATLAVDADGSLVVEVASLAASTASGADFTGDGTVDNDDLAVFAMFFGVEEGASVLTGDANGDGAVDAVDFFLLKGDFPSAVFPAATAVPEPATAVLVLLGLAGMSARRRSTT